MYELILMILLITVFGIAALIFRRPINPTHNVESSNTYQKIENTNLEKIESPISKVSGNTSSHRMSDEDFKILFLDSKNSVSEIAKSSGYKSKSSVYRRAKKLGLSVNSRK